ncbi:MAG: putative transport system permease protein [Actinomycetota bacterium]|nr:putative transport system permease protein [Actinomycetota bacterium]
MMWMRGLLRRHAGRLVTTATGVAVAVAMLASLGAFLAHSQSTMTRRSVANVPVDWQVESQPGSNGSQLLSSVRSYAGVRIALPVEFGQVTSLQATTGGTRQTTGAGFVLGIPDTYRTTFPAVIRNLIGPTRGVLVAQQTAASLHVAPGDSITIGRAGLSAIKVTADSVIDLPSADALFQVVGAPAGAPAQAPPDNVLIVPEHMWHQIFDPLTALRPDLVKIQIHARIDHNLPSDPAAAYSKVAGRANNLEVTLAGAGKVGDNLAATLASARADALYAQVLFLFLGLPGAVLAGLLTATVAAAGRDRRRREQGLLRTRGATSTQLVHLALAETALVGVIGSAVGLVAASIIGGVEFGSAGFGTSRASAVAWAAAATLVGLAVAAAAIAGPAWIDARNLTVSAARRKLDRRRSPRWASYGLDLWFLGAGALVFWLTSRGGYKLVLAPEGVPAISVNYWAFAGPALMWIGGGLLVWRIAELALRYGRRPIRTATRPLAGPLAGTVAASMQRQRRLLARGVALVALTATFAVSTAVFNATYRQQALVDAVLTNGADVTVTEPPGVSVGPAFADTIKTVPGIVHVEPLQHRYAYVGSDLQDLFGVNPATVVDAAKLQDAYFQGGRAAQLMQRLHQHPDGLIVSAETVKDFQLQPGDKVILRLQDARTKEYTPVTFHYAGVSREFPTAPRDSFLLANRDYVAAQTHSSAVGLFLINTGGHRSAPIADGLRRQLGAGVTVTDLTHTRRIIASSLTAVDLSGLTQVELGFALALAATATGLVLWLGFAERRRTFAIVHALGARPRQLGAFVWSEAGYVLGVGLALGAVGGGLLSSALVKILTGVFDPPPDTLAIPWSYLITAICVGLGAVIVAATLAVREASKPQLSVLREV